MQDRGQKGCTCAEAAAPGHGGLQSGAGAGARLHSPGAPRGCASAVLPGLPAHAPAWLHHCAAALCAPSPTGQHSCYSTDGVGWVQALARQHLTETGSMQGRVQFAALVPHSLQVMQLMTYSNSMAGVNKYLLPCHKQQIAGSAWTWQRVLIYPVSRTDRRSEANGCPKWQRVYLESRERLLNVARAQVQHPQRQQAGLEAAAVCQRGLCCRPSLGCSPSA